MKWVYIYLFQVLRWKTAVRPRGVEHARLPRESGRRQQAQVMNQTETAARPGAASEEDRYSTSHTSFLTHFAACGYSPIGRKCIDVTFRWWFGGVANLQ